MGLDVGNSGLGREVAGADLEDAAVRWQKVKDLFGDALEQDPAERQAFLAQACNGDEALRAEVESLLAAAQDPTDTAQPEPEPDRMLGRRLGAYQIVESIASGGMATVYLAHRADDQYCKRVAIKLIHPGLANDALCRRFRSERQTLAALDHPNIVKLLDGGSTEEGLPYLVMDFVDGQPIDQYCDQHQLTVEERLKLFRTVCGAVEHAHQNRIIHRDLKPSNILVTADGSLRLLDFGIAKLLNPELSQEMGLMTTAGIHHMTPAYASPEQVRGDEITYASDVYSLGVVLYELLTGHRPYRFKNYTQAEVERVICETEAERPSTIVTRAESDQGTEGSGGHIVTPEAVSQARGASLEKLRRRLKGDLDNIVLKALHKDPERRYSSVQGFSEDVARHLEDRPVKARPNTLQYRVRKLIRRRKTEVIAAAMVLSVLLSAATFNVRQDRRTKERAPTELSHQPSQGRQTVAVLGFKNLTGRAEAAWLSTALSEMLSAELSAGEKLRTIPGENISDAKIDLALPETDSLSREALGRVYKYLGSDFVVVGSYVDMPGAARGVRIDLRLQNAVAGDTAAVVEETGTETDLPDIVGRLGAQLRNKLGIGGVTPAELATVKSALPSSPEAARLYAEGLTRMRMFDALLALEPLQKAVAIDPGFALAHSALGDDWAALGYDENAKQEAKRAFDVSSRLSRENRLWIEARYRETNHEWNRVAQICSALFEFFPDNVEYGLKLANARLKAGNAQEALATIDGLRQLPYPSRDDPRIDLEEATITGHLHDLSRGREAVARALAKAKAMGSKMLLARVLMIHAGQVCWESVPQGVLVFAQARDLFREAGDQNGAASALNNIAAAYRLEGDLVSARSTAEDALATSRAAGNKEGIERGLSILGQVLDEEGDLNGARKAFLAELAITREAGVGMANSLENLSGVLSHQGDLNQARTFVTEALELYRQSDDRHGVALALSDLADIAHEQGNLGAADELCKQSLVAYREINDEGGVSAVNYILGKIRLAQGNFAEAKRLFEQAQVVAKKRGFRRHEAATKLDLARLAVEERRFDEAEQLAKQAAEEFRKSNSPQLGILAQSLLAQSLAAQNKLSETQGVLADVLPLPANQMGLSVRLPIAISAAQACVLASKFSNKAELEQATQLLRAALAEANRHGYLGHQYEARLELGEIAMKSGNGDRGRQQLSALEREARGKGFVLIATKAAHARQG